MNATQNSAQSPSQIHLQKILKQIFGFNEFRPYQESIILAALDNKDIFAALPTGGGKSLCYQLPSMVRAGLTVVVSPLIALMKDQVDAARMSGMKAACLNSAMDYEERRDVHQAIEDRTLKILYIAPERLGMEGALEKLADWGCSAIAVDESHCISEWGHEFRPDYRQLIRIRQNFPDIPLMAFTATATRRIQNDIINQLGLVDPFVVRAGFDRPEIFYRVEPKQEVLVRIFQFVKDRPGLSGIVYRSTRTDVEKTAAYLSKKGVLCAPYHAGLPDDIRKSNQEGFKSDRIPVIVATVAFGMGIDKPGVRFVIHGDLPKSLEAYYQETGRSGRDGANAETLLLWSAGDLAKSKWHISRMENPDERQRAEKSLYKMLRFADTYACRRRMLLAHFDDEHPGNCDKCDVCVGEVERVDATEDARKFLSAIVRTEQRYGAHFLVDIVRGTSTDRIIERGYQHLPTFGVGAESSRKHWLAIAGDLEANGYVYRDEDHYNVLLVTKDGKELLYGRREFFTIRRAKGKEKTHAIKKEDVELSDEDQRLFEVLRILRLDKAREIGKPPYIIFPDRTLRAMANLRPQTEQELLACPGVGENKLAAWGKLFLEEIRKFG